MVVQCEQCRTRFKLDDSKVGDKGVKVRCSKCRHIFLVRPERASATEEPDFDALFTGLVASPASGRSEESADLPDDSGISEPVSARFEGDDGQTVSGPDFSAGSDDESLEAAADTTAFPYSVDEHVTTPMENTASNLYDQATDSGKAEMAGAEAAASGSCLLDIPGVPDSSEEVGADESITVDATMMSDFSGEDAVTGGAAISDVTPEVAISAGQDDSEARQPLLATNLAADEPPPLAIASRRKSSSLLPLATAVVSVVVIVVLAGFGFYMMNKGPEAINSLGMASLAKWTGLNGSQEGSIILRGTKSEFMRNDEVGEIFVIRGEAVNDYKKPRSSIQVKATVFGAKGEQVSTRSAYCGNLISNDQLAALPMARIESAMNNQFGDSLANLVVKPGNAIPFVIVVPGVPKEASEFVLEVAGSTAANQ